MVARKTIAFIPELGTKLRLFADWTFTVHNEHRNHDLLRADGKMKLVPTYMQAFGHNGPIGPRVQSGVQEQSTLNKKSSYQRTLPKGTEVVVDRIFIRKGKSDFSSITLVITHTTDARLLACVGHKTTNKPRKTVARFWVKLEDFNDAFFEVV